MHSIGNNCSKNRKKILTTRPNSLQNNQKHSTLYSSITSNALHIVKKSLKKPQNKKIENNSNKLTFSNLNLV